MGSESELGSMSMEFDAVLAAAVAAGVRNSSGGGEINDERSTPRLAGIEEESNTHGHFTNAHETLPDADEGDLRGRGISKHHHVPGSSSTVMTLNGPPARLMNLQEIDTVGRDTNGQRINREEPGQHSETSILAPSSRAHSSSRREQQSENVPLQSLSSSRRVENSDSMLARSSIDSRRGETGTGSIARTSESALQDRSAANVGAIVPWMGDRSVEQAPISSSGNNTGQEKPPPKRVTLARIRREKLLAKASAWQEAITSKIDNRYKREESKIYAWEDHQKAKASIILKEAEMKLEQKRARAVEKMQNEIARVHKKAENQKAAAYAKRQEKVAKVVEEAEIIKKSGRVPSGCFPF
ncbi:hypothetical protein O6H91_16G009900 [Diphasiastrum complanatum]|nr:hypothetical protein O6H91_16G009900 [Diphasiastrum complanatum]